MRKSKFSYEEKITAVEKYKQGNGSLKSIAKELGIDTSSFKQWILIYDSQGKEGLLPKKSNRKYSKELKTKVVEEYISGKLSLTELCKKYKIFSKRQVIDWVIVYNGHKEYRSTGETGEIYMTKGRKTTFEERIEIVGYCIENGKDYLKTIEEFKVSYQQIYSWVNKYEAGGVEALTDRRGKAKDKALMTELDKVKAENKLLAAKLKDSEMEIKLLKKMKELERGGR